MSRFRTCRGSEVLVPSRLLGTAVRSVPGTAEGESVEQSVDPHGRAREFFVIAADGTKLKGQIARFLHKHKDDAV